MFVFQEDFFVYGMVWYGAMHACMHGLAVGPILPQCKAALNQLPMTPSRSNVTAKCVDTPGFLDNQGHGCEVPEKS